MVEKKDTELGAQMVAGSVVPKVGKLVEPTEKELAPKSVV